MRTIQARDVTIQVREALKSINFHTPAPLMERLQAIQEGETSPSGKKAMELIVDNRRIASQQHVPMCQDSGMALMFVDVGEEVIIVGGPLRDALTQAVREAYAEGYLRKSVVAEPLFDRKNTGDNTPPVIHFNLVPGDRLRISIAAKGFGAENMSWVKMLTPAQGIQALKENVVACVEKAGPNACPPIVVGIGVGGTMEMAALLAKRALMRPLGARHPDARYAGLEQELLTEINATGIGPQGWGGINTAMDVRIEYYPTHIAAIPLAINLDCHLHRHTELIL